MISDHCPHYVYNDQHCGEMRCWNYYNKCPKHAYSGRAEARCSHDTHYNKLQQPKEPMQRQRMRPPLDDA